MENTGDILKKIKISAIITAAGSGTRMKSKVPKQFLKINGVPIIERTLKKFYNIDIIDEIIVIVKEDEVEYYNKLKDKYHKKIKIVIGGETRERSTYNGLINADPTSDIILCHDGVRPFVKEDIIISSLQAMKDYNAVIVGVPVKDTIKSIRDDKTIAFTPIRKYLYKAQTPQVFKKDILLDAYNKCFSEDIQVTDDSSLMEIIGEKVKIIDGDYSNIKITTKEDLLFGEIIAKMEDEFENRNRI